MAVTVMREAGFEAFDNIAGGETAGIPFAALVAERLALPMTYVRKKPKGYGRNARIEGVMREGDRVLLVEDLATDGGSKLSFVDAIRETGGDLRPHRRDLLLRHLPGHGREPRRRTAWRCTTSAPGGTSWTWHASGAPSTKRPSTRSKAFSARPANGRPPARAPDGPRSESGQPTRAGGLPPNAHLPCGFAATPNIKMLTSRPISGAASRDNAVTHTVSTETYSLRLIRARP